MATVKTWLASAALVGGAGGGGAAVLASTGESAAPVTAARPVAVAPDASYLQQQIVSLLKEDHALKRAVARARVRLAGQVQAGEHSLAVLNRRILTAQSELAQAQAARARIVSAPAAVVRAPVSAPVAHATSGASGAGSRHGEDDGEHEGGHDD
jgi:hypothetical protein